jgi:hypothetical protein
MWKSTKTSNQHHSCKFVTSWSRFHSPTNKIMADEWYMMKDMWWLGSGGDEWSEWVMCIMCYVCFMCHLICMCDVCESVWCVTAWLKWEFICVSKERKNLSNDSSRHACCRCFPIFAAWSPQLFIITTNCSCMSLHSSQLHLPAHSTHLRFSIQEFKPHMIHSKDLNEGWSFVTRE